MSKDKKAAVTLPADLSSLAPARDFMRAYLHKNGLEHHELDIIITIGEVVQNVVRHAFMAAGAEGVFSLEAINTGSDLVSESVDDAPPSDPAIWSSAAIAPEHGGHGLRMIEELADEAVFFAMPDGNRAVIKFHLTRQANNG